LSNNSLTTHYTNSLYSDIVFLHKTNRELLEWAGALCWHEPETLSAEELKRRGNAVFSKNNDGKFRYVQTVEFLILILM
jgi:hypothetical protein